MFKNIDIEELHQMRERGAIHLIDVRTEAEVARGKIEGANHIPLHLLPLKVAELERGLPAVIYCQSGGRSMQACAYLASNGLTQLHNLQGGVMAWVRSGLALV